MAKKKSSEVSSQQARSTAEIRQDRQRRVTAILKYAGLSVAGGSGSFVLYQLSQGNFISALKIGLITFAATIFAIASKFISEVFDTVFDQIEIKLADQTEPLATWIVKGLEDWLLKTWWFLTSNFKGEYYQELIYTCRYYLTQGLDKGQVLKLQKVFVPLKISPQEVRSVEPRMIQKRKDRAENPRNKKIWDFLAAAKDKYEFRHLVILGAPGSGKTTLLRYIALTYASNTQRKVHPNAPRLIPVLLYLREIRSEITRHNPTLPDLITQQAKQQRKGNPLNPPPNWFKDRLDQCLVMLDGLDEVADSKEREQVRDWVNEQIKEYPNTFFILTSRPYGYKSAPLSQSVTALEVKPFSLKQTKDFLRNWYLATEIFSRGGDNDLGVQEEARKQADDLIERIVNNRAIAQMAVNPLLLTMIATVHRRGNVLPGKRVELYKEICQVLLEKRRRGKKIPDTLTASQKQSVLQKLAFTLMANETREFQLTDPVFRTVIQDQLRKVVKHTSPEEFIQKTVDVAGLLGEKELGVYEFSHLSFQEYLAAVEIKDTNQEDILVNNLDNSWWHETIRLHIAQSDATSIIQAALDNPTVDSMALAYDCLEEGLSVDEIVREELETMLDEDLASR